MGVKWTLQSLVTSMDRPHNRAVSAIFQVFGGAERPILADSSELAQCRGMHRGEVAALAVLVPLTVWIAIGDLLTGVSGYLLAVPLAFVALNLLPFLLRAKSQSLQWKLWLVSCVIWAVFQRKSGGLVGAFAHAWIAVAVLNLAAALVFGWRHSNLVRVLLLVTVHAAAIGIGFEFGWPWALVAGAGIFLIMITWKDGRRLLRKSLPPGMPLDDFIASISMAGALDEQNKLHRSQGTAVFLAGNPNGTPNALIKNIKHNQILHRQNIILTIITDPTLPHVPPEDRVEVSDRTEGFFRVVASFGFMETPHIDEVIRAAGLKGLVINRDKTTFFVGKERIVVSAKFGMAEWREHLFVFLSKHSENAADFFQLPPDRVYEVSQVVEI